MQRTLRLLLGLCTLSMAGPALGQIVIDNTLPGGFLDISATGTPLALADDGEVDIVTTIGNALLPAGTVRVGSNGGIRFGPGCDQLGITNQPIPSSAAFGRAVTLLPFWDDIDTENGLYGDIYWEQVLGTLIIQWENTAFFNGSPTQDTVTFQVQVHGAGPVFAQFLYEDVMQPRADGGGSATIGFQGGCDNNAQWSFNASGAVADGDVLSITGTIAPPMGFGDVVMVDTLPGTYMDISGTGAPLSLSDDGEVDIPTTVGNALLPAGNVRVGANGGVRFMGGGMALPFTNEALPSSAFDGDQTLFPFWDDIDIDSGLYGEIYWQEISGTLIIQWEDAAFFPGTMASDRVTFQLQVHSAGPALAQFLYQDVLQPRPNGGESATIGYQGGCVSGHVEWSFNLAGAVADGDVLSLLPDTGPIGMNYCGPAIPNSTGQAAVISADGSDIPANNDVTLTADDLPPGQFGYFLAGQTQGLFNPPGSSGLICLQGDIGRYNQVANIIQGPTGSIQIDLTAIPVNPPQAVMSGETWNFQCWYRDANPGPTSNFTDAVSVVFQ